MKSRSSAIAGRPPTCEDKLKIIIRIRPVLNEQQPSMFVQLQDNDTLEIRRPGNHSYMKFNNILPTESTQKDVFLLVEDSIRQFLHGINTTIFAYGQTGAGKTYSIIGNYSPNENQDHLYNFLSSKERGVLSRSLQMVMEIAAKEPQSRFYACFYEIYNEKIFDLYNYTNVSLDIRESKNGEISIPDLVTIQIDNMQDAIKFLMIGLRNRATGSTQANSKSSRSHSIFQMSMEKQEGDTVICSSLRIVDLAGSEKFKIPNDLTNAEKDIRIQELTSINGSLSCLGHCISALIDKTRTHIPFRNSKLTRILSDSLLGQGKMRFIICISPSISASAQTFSTLQFANRAKRAIFDRTDNKSPSMQKKKLEAEQVLTLKKQLQKQKQMRQSAERQIGQLKKQNDMLKAENSKLLKRLQCGEVQMRGGQKQVGTGSKLSHYDKNKQNDFKEQMLKLTIFQKNRPEPHNPPSHHVSTHIAFPKTESSDRLPNKPYSNSQVNQQQVSKVLPPNKKKAEFEKKIRKFIEADSPHRPNQRGEGKGEARFEPDAFENGHNSELERHINEAFGRGNTQQSQEDNLWDSHQNDSNELIQKTCNRMNLSEFQELKSEMERARRELLNLQRKDNELEQRKQGMH